MMLVILKVNSQACLARVSKATRESVNAEQPETDAHCRTHKNELKRRVGGCVQVCVCVFTGC